MHVTLDLDSLRVVKSDDHVPSVDEPRTQQPYNKQFRLRICAPPFQVVGKERCFVRFLGPVSNATTKGDKSTVEEVSDTEDTTGTDGGDPLSYHYEILDFIPLSQSW